MGPCTNSSMPTAAAVAAAAATAKIQAMDATNAVLGLSTPPSLGIVSSIPNASLGNGTMSAITTSITNTLPNTTAGLIVNPLILPAPQIVTPTLGKPIPTPPVSAATAVNISSLPLSMSQTQLMATSTSPPHHNVGSSATAAVVNSHNPEDILKKAQEKQQEELQKKLLEDGEPQTLQQQESMSIKGQSARHLVMQRLMRPRDSKVVILRNMVGPEDVDETLQEEIQEECSKFGIVERVIIYKEKQTENELDDESDVIVKIFVEFSISAESEKAKDALNGRYFGGRLVKAETYDQTLFDHGDLSG